MIQNNMSVRKNKRQARKYPSTDFLLLLCIMLFCRCSIHQSNERINLDVSTVPIRISLILKACSVWKR